MFGRRTSEQKTSTAHRTRGSESFAQEQSTFFSRFALVIATFALVVSLRAVGLLIYSGLTWMPCILGLIALVSSVTAFALFRQAALWDGDAEYEASLHQYNQTSRL